MKKLFSLALCIILAASVFAACGKEVVSKGTTSKSDAPKKTVTEAPAETKKDLEPKSTDPLLNKDDIPAADLSAIDTDYQTAAPKEGEEVAILHTDYGDISMRFFPEVAPMAVENFKALAKAGRYDNILFHRITSVDTAGCEVIQSGDYTNFNGTGGASAFGEEFGLEISDYVTNIRGSVAMANTGMPDSNGSQFYINTSNNNFLDGGYTVFAQVYDGMDVVDQIHAVERDANDAPIDPIYINSVEITAYQ